MQLTVPESWTVPFASTWLKSAEPGRRTNRVAVAMPVVESPTGWCWLPSVRRPWPPAPETNTVTPSMGARRP